MTQRFCREHKEIGLPIQRLNEVAELVGLLSQGIKRGIKCFVDPLYSLIALHALPFSRSRSFEGLEFSEAQERTFRAIACAVECREPSIIGVVSSVVSHFADQANGRYSTNGHEIEVPFQVLERCGIAEKLTRELERSLRERVGERGAGSADSGVQRAVVERTGSDEKAQGALAREGGVIEYDERSLAFSPGRAAVTQQLLETLRNLSYYEGCAQDMVKFGLVSILPVFLRRSFRDPVVALALEVLWNIFEVFPAASREFRRHDANFGAVADLLERLGASFRSRDREIRNDVAAMLCLLARDVKNHNRLALNGCIRVALSQSTSAELSASNPGSKTLSRLDFTYKCLLWSFLLSTTRSGLVLSLSLESHIVEAMLVYLDPSQAKSPCLMMLNEGQLAELRGRALQFLTVLLPKVPLSYVEKDVHSILMAFLAERYREVSESDQSVEASMRLLEGVLACLLKVSSLGDLSGVQLTEADLELLLDMYRDPDLAETERANAIGVVAAFSSDNPISQKMLRKVGGIRLLAAASKALAESEEALLLCTTISCVRRAIIGNHRNEIHWLRLDGMSTLLRVLCSCPEEMRALALACVSDLLLNPKAVPLFWEWRGPVCLADRVLLSLERHLPKGETMRTPPESKLGNAAKPDDEDAVTLFLKIWQQHYPRGTLGELLRAINNIADDDDMVFAPSLEVAAFVAKSIQMTKGGDFVFQMEPDGEIYTAPRDLVHAVEDEFTRYDADGSRSLDAQEIIPIVRKLGLPARPSFIRSWMKAVDVDGNGTLEFNEILAFVLLMINGREIGIIPDKLFEKPKQLSPDLAAILEHKGQVQELGDAKGLLDANVADALYGIASLIGKQHVTIDELQRSQLSAIMRYQELLHGLQWIRIQRIVIDQLRKEDLQALKSDLNWVDAQIHGFETTLLQLQSFAFDQRAAMFKMEEKLTGYFMQSFKVHAEQKKHQLAKRKSRSSVRLRKEVKAKKEMIVKKSLDQRKTLLKTLRCQDSEVEGIIKKIDQAKLDMTKRFEASVKEDEAD